MDSFFVCQGSSYLLRSENAEKFLDIQSFMHFFTSVYFKWRHCFLWLKMDSFYYAQYGLKQGCHMEGSLQSCIIMSFCNQGYVRGKISHCWFYSDIDSELWLWVFYSKIEKICGVTECTWINFFLLCRYNWSRSSWEIYSCKSYFWSPHCPFQKWTGKKYYNQTWLC